VMDRRETESFRGTGRYLAGARASLPFALATLMLGISFGALARSLGWGIVAPIVFSVVAFSGSAQFAVAAVLGAGAGRSLRSSPPCCSTRAPGLWASPSPLTSRVDHSGAHSKGPNLHPPILLSDDVAPLG
jgi:hypothetical protein